MGRNRTLAGTTPALLRISERLLESLDSIAEAEGVSRNTLISRILAEHVLEREKA